MGPHLGVEYVYGAMTLHYEHFHEHCLGEYFITLIVKLAEFISFTNKNCARPFSLNSSRALK